MKRIGMFFLTAGILMVWSVPGWANPKHLQAYKKAYPDAKAKCSVCHLSDKVTKTDYELNAYGAKAAEMGDPSQERYEAIGSADQFDPNVQSGAGEPVEGSAGGGDMK